jgi:hypothetical protein
MKITFPHLFPPFALSFFQHDDKENGEQVRRSNLD